jgi:hypothetical protein
MSHHAHNISLILANLTLEDDRSFHAAGIPYSGATGPGADPEAYNGLAPYIATTADWLERAVHAMGWDDFSVQADGAQWIVRSRRNAKLAVDAFYNQDRLTHFRVSTNSPALQADLKELHRRVLNFVNTKEGESL